MTTAAPTLDARVIALAFLGPRALLDSALTGLGTDFEQSVVLRTLAGADGPVDRTELVAGVGDTLKTAQPLVRAAVERLADSRLIEPDPADPAALRLTDTGRELHERITAEGAGIAARLYAGIPAEDLATAGRVLSLITERANTELARA